MKAPQLATTPRTGITGYCAPYHPNCAKRLKDGRLTLEVKKVKGALASGCFFGPRAELGTYVFEIDGRLDAMDPSVVFAIWTYDEATKDEVDAIEYTRWGDSNQPHAIYTGDFKAGLRATSASASAKAFDRYRVTLTLAENHWVTRIEGWWEINNCWKEIYSRLCDRKFMALGQIRMALWVPEKGLTQPYRAHKVHITRSEFVPHRPPLGDSAWERKD